MGEPSDVQSGYCWSKIFQVGTDCITHREDYYDGTNPYQLEIPQSGLVYTSTKHGAQGAESEVIVRRTDKCTSATLSHFDSGFQCTRGTEILMVSSMQIPVLPLGHDALARGIYQTDTARGMDAALSRRPVSLAPSQDKTRVVSPS